MLVRKTYFSGGPFNKNKEVPLYVIIYKNHQINA
jgi:hypothetical protein